MGKAKKLLQDCVGIGGYEKLEKAIVRRGPKGDTEIVPQSFLAFRTILSWLAQNVQHLKVGESKELQVPGKDGAVLHIHRDGEDSFSGHLVEDGEQEHSFEKLDAAAVTKDTGIAQEIVDMSGVPHDEQGESEWMRASEHAKELTQVVGKLIDALISRHIGYQDSASVLDAAIGKKELKIDYDVKPIKQDVVTAPKATTKEDPAPKLPKSKQAPFCEEHCDPKVEVAKAAPKEQSDRQKISANRWFRMSLREKKAAMAKMPSKEQRDAAMAAAIEAVKKPVKKDEVLQKPYVSEAQRRWAHTSAGKKALGGEAAVSHWDKETKGKKLPEKVAKKATDEEGFTCPSCGKVVHDEGEKCPECAAAEAEQSRDAKMNKAAMAVEKPAGSALPKSPSPPKALTPKAAGTNRAPTKGQAVKQPAAISSPSVSAKQPKPQSAAMATKVEVSEQAKTYFRTKLAKVKGTVKKAEKSYIVSESEIYTPCPHCGVPEFIKSNGQPRFKPCHCFMIMAKNEEGQSIPFVEIVPKGDSYQLNFSSSVDADSIHAFLTNLRSRLLKQKGSAE